MNTFKLQIVTPEGLMEDDEVCSVTVRTAAGDVGILAGHADYVAPVNKGSVKITDRDGNIKTAGCGSGLISVKGGIVRVVAESFIWNEGH